MAVEMRRIADTPISGTQGMEGRETMENGGHDDTGGADDRAPRQELPAVGVMAIALAGFCAFLIMYATQPLLPLFESLFDVSKAEAGLTVSAATVAMALMAPIIGAVADRIGRKRLIVIALFALAVPTLLAASSRGLGDLLLWRFLQGAAIPGIYVLAIAYITEEAGPAAVGKVMAAYVAGTVVGGFCGRFVTGMVAAHAGWREAFVVLGIMVVGEGLAVWRWLPASRSFTPRRRPTAEGTQWGLVLRDGRLLATYAIGFCVLFSLVASFTYVAFYLGAPPFALSPAALSGIFAVYLIGAVATPIAGRWIDRIGSRTVLIASLGAGAAGMALTLVHALPLVIAGLALCCTSVFICQASSTSYLRIASPPSHRSLASGIYVTCYYVGGSIGGLLPGLLWERAGWSGCVGLVIGAQLVTIGIAAGFWSPAHPRPRAVT